MINKNITIIGGGPVGSLLSIYLRKYGHPVNVYEKRSDLRLNHKTEGRSINIALSHRGLKALDEAGLNNFTSMAIPMKGRMIHDEKGIQTFQPYGEEGQMIYSVSRNQLNEILLEEAEKKGVDFHFNTQVNNVDVESGKIEFTQLDKKNFSQAELIFGADGAFSTLRNSFKSFSEFSFHQEFLSHGYIELHIPAASGQQILEKNALHIWPRAQFMLIALPNLNGSFTATLFLPFKGANSFETLKTHKEAEIFFQKFFPDALMLMPDLKKDFFAQHPSSLVTIHCFPWVYKGKAALIGDAAHAITPFYGQGMNAGFEDCRILNTIIESSLDNWEAIFKTYQLERKENADAIAELALQNFIEMRDLVGNKKFIMRKKIESKIHQKYSSYIPLYSMVTFSDLPYKTALDKGKVHDLMMNEVMSVKNIDELWETEKGWEEIEKIVKKYI